MFHKEDKDRKFKLLKPGELIHSLLCVMKSNEYVDRDEFPKLRVSKTAFSKWQDQETA